MVQMKSVAWRRRPFPLCLTRRPPQSDLCPRHPARELPIPGPLPCQTLSGGDPPPAHLCPQPAGAASPPPTQASRSRPPLGPSTSPHLSTPQGTLSHPGAALVPHAAGRSCRYPQGLSTSGFYCRPRSGPPPWASRIYSPSSVLVEARAAETSLCFYPPAASLCSWNARGPPCHHRPIPMWPGCRPPLQHTS